MSIAKKAFPRKAPVATQAKARSAAPGKSKVPVVKKEIPLAKPASRKLAVPVSAKAATIKVLVPEAPESSKKGGANKRKRLSKAFPRPLDKKIKQAKLVRDCFSFPEAEYAYLVGLKKRFLAAGVSVKKSELLRAGLALLASLDDDDIKGVLAKVPHVG